MEVIRARSNIPTWQIRRGAAMDAKGTLRSQQLYAFPTTFVELVRSRVREFPALAASSAAGLGPPCSSCSPQTEVSQDLYATMHGVYVHFVTTAREKPAQSRARALMSGFQIPFFRK